jgi:large subunit ribosomal protein L5
MSFPIVEGLYKNKVAKQLQEELKVKIPPRIVKVVLNMGVGKAANNKKHLEVALSTLTAIAGQKAQQTLARRSESGFGIRTGWPIGCKVTLRRRAMFEFIDKYLQIAIPSIANFYGLNGKSFDGQGNYTTSLHDCSVFTECDIEQDRIGMDITVVTSATHDEVAYKLLSMLGFPFKEIH